jgi:hypothetical protein
MPRSKDKPYLGRWRFVGDRAFERELFLEAIRNKNPDTLKDLFETVLPVHLKTHKRRIRRPKLDSSLDFWSEDCDVDTWRRAWEWADRASLSRGMALDILKQSRAIELAEWVEDEMSWRRRRLKRLPRRLTFPFRINTSPEITFGLPLLGVVWHTLMAWSKTPPDKKDLQWHFPKVPPPLRYYLPFDKLTGLLDVEYMRKRHLPILYFGPPPRTYTFSTFVWDILGETAAQAKKAILKEIASKLDQEFNTCAQSAAAKPYFERHPTKRELAHFEYLVIYQVRGGFSFTDVTRQADSQKADPQKARSPVTDSEVAAVTKGIKITAKALVGPRFADWLRPGAVGRPAGSIANSE